MTSIPSFSKAGLTRPVRRPAAVTVPTNGGHERLWLPLAIVAAAVIGVAGWMLLVSPLRGDTAAVAAQTTTATQQVDRLRAQLATLQSEQADLPRLQADLKAAQAALPTTAALPTFLRTLQTLGTDAGVDVSALTAQAPAAVGADGAPLTAAGTTASLYEVPITVTAAGSYEGLTAFVGLLQQKQPRAVLVTGATENSEASSTTLTLSLTAFFAPDGGSKAGS